MQTHAKGMKMKTMTWMESDSQNVLCASSLINTEIRNPSNELVGRIRELMIDAASSEIVYVIFAAESGPQDDEEVHYVLPWAALSLAPEQGCMVLDIDKNWLKYLPAAADEVIPGSKGRTFHQTLYHSSNGVREGEA